MNGLGAAIVVQMRSSVARREFFRIVAGLAGALGIRGTASASLRVPRQYDAAEKSIAALQADLVAERTTSEDLVRAYASRIDALDRSGPQLRSIVSLNPEVLSIARGLDAERASGLVRGPLHGIPVLVKDNIETADAMPTTAGSLALKDNITRRDSPVVARLRTAGAIVLGKANLSEWANVRSPHSTNGWSAMAGLTRNPYCADRSAGGSSSGSAVAVAASLAAAALGTETDGSIVNPASLNGIVGLKPTRGLVPNQLVVPVAPSMDVVGPMTRSVGDLAVMLAVMASTESEKKDYASALKVNALRGKRIGILPHSVSFGAAVLNLFQAAIRKIRKAGAEVVEIESSMALPEMRKGQGLTIICELKRFLSEYLGTTPLTVSTRTLGDVIAFDRLHADSEMRFFGQENFEQAELLTAIPDYRPQWETAVRAAGPEGIDRLLAANRLDALIAPTAEPAFAVDLVHGDKFPGFNDTTTPPAVAGYPHLTVPIGKLNGLPVGLSFIGAAWSEARLLALGYAFEQLTHARLPPPLTLPR